MNLEDLKLGDTVIVKLKIVESGYKKGESKPGPACYVPVISVAKEQTDSSVFTAQVHPGDIISIEKTP